MTKKYFEIFGLNFIFFKNKTKYIHFVKNLLWKQNFVKKFHHWRIRVKRTWNYIECLWTIYYKQRTKKINETRDLRYIYQLNKIKSAFSMIWFMVILKNHLEKQLLIKYYMMKHLTLYTILNMMGIKVNLLQWFMNFLIKNQLVVLLKVCYMKPIIRRWNAQTNH